MKLGNFRPFLILLLISLAHSSLAEDRPYKEYKNPIFFGELFGLRLNEVLPPDAAEYVALFRTCQHWRGEPVYSEERSKEISSGIQKSCVGLEERWASIRDRYKEESRESEVIVSIVREIEAGEQLPSFVLNDPLRKSVVLNEYYEALAQFVIRSLAKQMSEYQTIVEKLGHETAGAPGTSSEQEKAKFKLEVQRRYVVEIMKNIDRLHPTTRERIKRLDPRLSQMLAASS
jgi:hypothetical protein